MPNLEDMQPFTASELKGMLYDNGVTNTTTTQLGGLIKKFARTDGYGNTSADNISFTSTAADDGRMNFRDVGDIIDATSQIYTEIIGSTDTGVGVNLSLVGSINPVLDITNPDFKKLTAKFVRIPELSDVPYPAMMEPNLVVEYYSR